jgi:hypothetical protein
LLNKANQNQATKKQQLLVERAELLLNYKQNNKQCRCWVVVGSTEHNKKQIINPQKEQTSELLVLLVSTKQIKKQLHPFPQKTKNQKHLLLLHHQQQQQQANPQQQ